MIRGVEWVGDVVSFLVFSRAVLHRMHATEGDQSNNRGIHLWTCDGTEFSSQSICLTYSSGH